MRFAWVAAFVVAGVVACGAKIEGDAVNGGACPSDLSRRACPSGDTCTTQGYECYVLVDIPCSCIDRKWVCETHDAGSCAQPPPGNDDDDCLLPAKQGAYCPQPGRTCPFYNNCGVIGSCTCIGTKWDCPSCPMKLDAGTD